MSPQNVEPAATPEMIGKNRETQLRRLWLGGIPFIVTMVALLGLWIYSSVLVAPWNQSRYEKHYSNALQKLQSAGKIDFSSDILPFKSAHTRGHGGIATEEETELQFETALLCLNRLIELRRDDVKARFEYAQLLASKADWLDESLSNRLESNQSESNEKKRKALDSAMSKAKSLMQSIAISNSNPNYQAKAATWLIELQRNDPRFSNRELQVVREKNDDWIRELRAFSDKDSAVEQKAALAKLLVEQAYLAFDEASATRDAMALEAESILRGVSDPTPSTLSTLAEAVAFHDLEASRSVADQALHQFWQLPENSQRALSNSEAAIRCLILIGTKLEAQSLVISQLRHIAHRKQAAFRRNVANACFRQHLRLNFDPAIPLSDKTSESLGWLDFAIQLDTENERWMHWAEHSIDSLHGRIDYQALDFSATAAKPMPSIASWLKLIQIAVEGEDETWATRAKELYPLLESSGNSYGGFAFHLLQRLHANKKVSFKRSLELLDLFVENGPNLTRAKLTAIAICLQEKDVVGGKERLDQFESGLSRSFPGPGQSVQLLLNQFRSQLDNLSIQTNPSSRL